MARTASEMWQILVDEAGEDEIERASKVSFEDAVKELEAAGFDVQKELERGEAYLAAMARGGVDEAKAATKAKEKTPAQEVSRTRARTLKQQDEGRRMPPVVVIAATVAAAAAVGGLAYSALHRDEKAPPAPSSPPSVKPPPSDSELIASAVDLRRLAGVAFNEGNPSRCLELLDRAKKEDPAGDATEDVQKLREQAKEQLRLGPESQKKL
jgi:hypothetical protein